MITRVCLPMSVSHSLYSEAEVGSEAACNPIEADSEADSCVFIFAHEYKLTSVVL